MLKMKYLFGLFYLHQFLFCTVQSFFSSHTLFGSKKHVMGDLENMLNNSLHSISLQSSKLFLFANMELYSDSNLRNFTNVYWISINNRSHFEENWKSSNKLYITINGFFMEDEDPKKSFELFYQRHTHDPVLHLSWPSINECFLAQYHASELLRRISKPLKKGQASPWIQAKVRSEIMGYVLADFLKKMHKKYPTRKVYLVGHSLGARVIYRAVTQISKESESASYISLVVLMGAAMSIKSEQLLAIQQVLNRSNGLLFHFYSSKDNVLRYLFDIANTSLRYIDGVAAGIKPIFPLCNLVPKKRMICIDMSNFPLTHFGHGYSNILDHVDETIEMLLKQRGDHLRADRVSLCKLLQPELPTFIDYLTHIGKKVVLNCGMIVDGILQLLISSMPILQARSMMRDLWNNNEMKQGVSYIIYGIAKVTQVALLVLSLFFTATMLYTVLYYSIMPSHSFQRPIYYDYGPHSKVSGAYRSMEKYLPRARINLVSSRNQWIYSNLTSQREDLNRLLTSNVAYDILLEFKAPNSKINTDIGMFMVMTELQTHDGNMLAQSSRPAIIHDHHWIIRFVQVVFYSLPAMFGFSEAPSQHVSVIAFNGYMESSKNPFVRASIELSHPQLQIYSATFTVITQLNGIRYLMFHWFLPTAILAILNIAFVEVLILMSFFICFQFSSEESTTPKEFSSRQEVGNNVNVPNSGTKSQRLRISVPESQEKYQSSSNNDGDAISVTSSSGIRHRGLGNSSGTPTSTYSTGPGSFVMRT